MSRLDLMKAAIVAAALSTSSGASGADDPLARLIGSKAGNGICFSRTYDAAHLKRNPAQTTTAMVLSLRYDIDNAPTVRIALNQKGKPVRYVFAGCEWDGNLKGGGGGVWWNKAFTKDAAFACIATMRSGSAEEGGDFLFDLQPDGASLVLYLGDRIGAYSSTDVRREATRMKLGRDDQIFRLSRVDAGACRAMERDLVDR